MKVNPPEMTRAMDSPPAHIRLFFLFGPDDSGSRAMIKRLSRAMGPDAEKIDIDSSQLKTDPARLADEAASISLFGGKRYVVVSLTGNGEDAMPAIESFLSLEVTGNPVVLLGGALKNTATIVKTLVAHKAVMVCANYVPKTEDLINLAMAQGREEGLRLSAEAARQLVRLSGGDRAVMAKEVEKLALYLDAAPDRPREGDVAALDAIGAGSGETEMAGFTAAVMEGNPAVAAMLTAKLAAEGTDGIGLLRVLGKRVQALVPLRAKLAAGESLDSLTANIFFKDKPPTLRQLSLWSPEKLATASSRLLEAERAIKQPGAVGPILADVEVIAISRAAQRSQ